MLSVDKKYTLPGTHANCTFQRKNVWSVTYTDLTRYIFVYNTFAQTRCIRLVQASVLGRTCLQYINSPFHALDGLPARYSVIKSTVAVSNLNAVNVDLDIVVGQATTSDFAQVALLRANAYFANDNSRFVGSFKKQFVAKEVESLQERTQITSAGTVLCECLVAYTSSGTVVGCVDIRIPYSKASVRPTGVPDNDPEGAYLLNIVVHEDYRGQGVGGTLMRAAMARAVQIWGAGNLYTHVDADNEVAYRLYRNCGFEDFSDESKYESSRVLGRRVLMRATTESADLVLGSPGLKS